MQLMHSRAKQKKMKMNENNKVKKSSKVNIFSFIPVVIGFVFLSNPLLGLVDFLPDFIGYFLIIYGLDRVKRLNGDIEYGVKNLKYLMGISGVFFVLMFYTFKMDSSWNLTLTFSYMILCVLFGTMAINGIFNGLDYLTDRHGSEKFPSVFEPKLMTKVYIWCKAILVLIPELYALVEVDAKGDISIDKDYAAILSTEKYAISVCFVLSIGLAIAWLRYVIKYCQAFKNDKVLNDNLNLMYKNDFSKDGIPINFFNINLGNGLILVSHVFIYDFVLDTVHFFPEFISVITSALGLLLIRKYLESKGVLKYGIFSFAFQIAIFFYRNYYIENVILDLLDVTTLHLVISSLLALGYIIFTFMYFSEIHKITSVSYEKMFDKKLIEVYEWGDIFFFIALACSGANIIYCIWRPYFVAVMIVSLFIAMYHYTKIYTKFD